MVWREFRYEDIRLCVEYVFWPVMEMEIPDLYNPIGIVWCRQVLGVRRQQ